jgi:hypothetical protein
MYCFSHLSSDRILQNYSEVPNQYVRVEDLLQHYLKDVASKENFYPSHYEICRVVKRIFPMIKESKTRPKEDELKRNRVYINIARYDILQNCPLSLSFEYVKTTYQPKHGFYRSAQSPADAVVLFVHVNWRHRCGGNPVVIELTIHEDLDFQVNIAGKRVATYNHLSRLSSVRDLDNLMLLVTVSDLCRGFVVSSERASRDINGQTTGVCERWSSDQNNTFESRHQSLYCERLLHIAKKSLICHSCNTIRENWHKSLCADPVKVQSKENLKSKRREDTMDRAELIQKLKEERRLKNNALRRERYLQKKINEGMLVFDNEDNDDFTKIFEKVGEDKVPDNFKLMWKEQAKALSVKGSSGNRWHPM